MRILGLARQDIVPVDGRRSGNSTAGQGTPLSYNRMAATTPDEAQADQLFHALADSTRRDIVARAIHGEHSVSVIARRYPMSFAAVQKHVAVLERADLVTRRQRGREQSVHVNIDAIRTAKALLDHFEGWGGSESTAPRQRCAELGRRFLSSTPRKPAEIGPTRGQGRTGNRR